jgi:hypothetical protein
VSDAPPLDDDAPPLVEQPRVSLAPVAKAAKANASLDVSWSAADASGVAAYEVEWQAGAGAWQAAQLSGPSAAVTSLQVPYGKRFRVRVRATDTLGNESDWTEGPQLRVVLYDDGSSSVTRAGGWIRRSESRSFGRAYRRSSSVGATARLAYEGLQVAWIGLVGPRNGAAQVRLDGALVASVPTYASSADVRRMLYVGPLGEDGPAESVIEVRNAGSGQLPRVELDAFLVLEVAD